METQPNTVEMKEASPIRISVSEFVKKMHPQTKKTRVPQVVAALVHDLKPVCQNNPLNEKGTEDNHLIVCGSSIKRFLLGEPLGYDLISKPFEEIPVWLRNPQNPLENKVLEKIATGGIRDLDMMYVLKKGKRPEEFFNTLYYSFIGQGFEESEDDRTISEKQRKYVFFRGKDQVERVEIDCYDKGAEIATPIQFYKISFYRNSQFVLKLDLVQTPNGKLSTTDFRFNGFTPALDVLATGEVYAGKDNHSSYIVVNPRLRHYFNRFEEVKIWHASDGAQSLFGRLRSAGGKTMWPKPRESELYSLRQLLDQFNQAGLTFPTSWKYLNESDEQAKLEERQADFVSEFLVYTAYDPFLFLKLAFESQVIKAVPLGQYIKDHFDLMKITAFMAEEVRQELKNAYLQDPTNTLPQLSRMYILLKLCNYYRQIEFMGPFMLVRALNRLLEEKGQRGQLPETLTTAVALFNPLLLASPTPPPAQ